MRLDVTGGNLKRLNGKESLIKLEITPVNRELQAALRSISMYDGKSRLRIEKAVQSAVGKMKYQAEKGISNKSGNLKKSLFSSFHRAECTGYFGAKAPHAHLLEMGVNPSTAKPKKKKTLLLIGIQGNLIYPTRAKIPRRYPRPFIRPAYEKERPGFVSELKKAVKS